MNATIQEIEGIDDYWGPAFRSVYEGEGHEAFVQQLDERIVQHDKEIEKLCNFHYQKKRKRSRRRPNKRGVCEDKEETLPSSISQYEDNNNHITKRRRIDPKRLGGYINTFPEPGTQCEPSDLHNSSKVSDHNSSNEDLEETSDMGISSDEYEKITEYHTLHQRKPVNHQLISNEPDSSTDDLRLYLRNRNRLTASVDRQNLLISVEEAGYRSEQQSEYSRKDSADCQISMLDQIPVDKEVDVNSANDLRTYLRSKLSDEQLVQDKSSHAENFVSGTRQSRGAIRYEEINNHQVEFDREQKRSLSSKYNKQPRQYDNNIRIYEKGQSRRASVEYNKDQIRSLSTERFRTQNRHQPIEYDRHQSRILSSEHTWRQSLPAAKHYEQQQSRRASAEHDKVQGLLPSERNKTRSRHENCEYDKGQGRHLASQQERSGRKGDRQRVKNRPMSAEDDRGQDLPDYNERNLRPSRPSSSEHNTSRNLHENIECSQSPYSFKEHIRPRSPYVIKERDEINGQRVFAHQLRGQRHYSAGYDSGDSYSREESKELPKTRSRRHLSTEHDIIQSRPYSYENNKRLHPIRHHKDQNQEQAWGSRRISTDYDRKSLSSHESAEFHGGQDRQAEWRHKSKSRPLPSERYQSEIQDVTMEYQRKERSDALSDKKSQRRPSSAKNYVQSGQSTEYIRGRNRSDSSKGQGCRNRPASADSNIRQNHLSYSEFESEIRNEVSDSQKSRKGPKINKCISGEQGSIRSDYFSGVQTDLHSADMTATHMQSYVSADLQHDRSQGYPKPNQVYDRPLITDITRQIFSETCKEEHPSLPETQHEEYRKSPDREDLSQPLSTQRTTTSVEMCKNTDVGQHNSAPGKISKLYYDECPAKSSSVKRHSISNRVTASQFFQNEILELELSHVERNDIENQKSIDCPQNKPDITKLKSCYDGLIDASETVLISDSDTDISIDILSSPRCNTPFSKTYPGEQNVIDHNYSYGGLIDASERVLISDLDTDITMDLTSSRSKTPLSITNPGEKNATVDFSNIDLRSKLSDQLEASALLPSRGLSETRDHSCEAFAEISSIQDTCGNNYDSMETVIVDLNLKTDDVRQCFTPEADVKSEPNDTSYDAISFNASKESTKVTGSRLNQDNKAPERLPQCHVKSEPTDHYTDREISSAVDGNIAQNILQETPNYYHKCLSQNCDTVTLSGFIKSETVNETLNMVESTLETVLCVNSSCGPNDEDKQGQATAKSSAASSNDGHFKVSVRDVNSINLFLSGAKNESLNAVLNKTDDCEDDHSKTDVSVVTTHSWYTPRKITIEKYPDKQEKHIFGLVNSVDPRLRPRIKNTTIEILNEQNIEVINEKEVAKSEKNIETDNTIARKSNVLTSTDGQNGIHKDKEENERIAPNVACKYSKLVLDIPNSSKDTCSLSNKAQISPDSPQIQDELFTCLKPIDIETQVAKAIPGYDPSNKNHNINDWIDSVNKVAAVCKWSEQQVLGYAIPKIKGCDSNSNLSWSDWQEKLRTAFPPKVNYGKMLLNMLNTTAKVGDSLVEYYNQKKTLLDKCNITGEKAIECIIFGIEDESVRTILESLDFDNQEQLLTVLSSFKK